MEVLCGSYARGRARIAVIRAFNQLGPGQSPAFAASGFARQVAAAEGPARRGSSWRSATSPPPATSPTCATPPAPFVEVSRRELTGTFNLCSGRALKLEALVEEMAKATPLPLRVNRPLPARPVDPSVVYGDPPASARRSAGAADPLSQTVADLLDWWRAELAAA